MWIFAWITDNIYIADIASIIGTMIGLYQFWLIIGNSVQMTKFLQIGALSLLIIQNLSWFISSLVHYVNYNYNLESTLIAQLKLSVGEYSLSIIYISMFALVLAILSMNQKISKIESGISKSLYQLKEISLQKIATIAFVLLLFGIFMLSSGIIGQRVVNVVGIDKGDIPIWLPIYEVILNFCIVLNVVYFINIFKIKYKSPKLLLLKLLLLCSFFATSLLFFTKGRSPFLLSLLFHLYWFYFFTEKKPNLKKSFVWLIIIYPIISTLLLFNNYARHGEGARLIKESENKANSSVITFLPKVFVSYINSSFEQKEEKSRSISNFSTRTLVAQPLALCIKLPTERKRFFLGENIENSIIWVIPRSIFPDKTKYAMQEDLLYQNFPINLTDTADSLYLYSYADFGWLGLIIYPYLIVIYWRLILMTLYYLKSSPVFLAIVFSGFLELFTIGIGESAIVQWLSVLRTFFIIVIAGLLVKMFSKNKVNHLSKFRNHENYISG
jgi:hypothetical protein